MALTSCAGAVKADMESEEIKEARKVLEEISQDEKERRLTELREKYRRDQHAIMKAGYNTGYNKGLDAGLEKGLEQGIEQGKSENKKEIAKKMLEKKVQIEQIEIFTGLTKEEIEELKNLK